MTPAGSIFLGEKSHSTVRCRLSQVETSENTLPSVFLTVCIQVMNFFLVRYLGILEGWTTSRGAKAVCSRGVQMFWEVDIL